MSELTGLFLHFLLGIALGLIFFISLLWTVKRGLKARSPAFFFISSYFVRIFLVVSGFYFFGANRIETLVAMLVGFVLSRYLFIREKIHEPRS